MTTITINRFEGGMAADIYGGNAGEFSISKQFDILTYPNRLVPLRGMSNDTASTGIGNLIVNSTDGLLYGVGADPLSPTQGMLWQRSGYGGSDVWQQLSPTSQGAGATSVYDLLVDWRNAGHTRTLHWAAHNLLLCSDPTGSSIVQTYALTFSTIGQGFVHPADQILYIPYNTSSNCLIAALTSNGSAFGAVNATALTLPKQYRVYGLCSYGNYLAIPATSTNVAGVSTSRVFFWSRDTTQSWDYDIAWGGDLKVLNNLNGTLIGISTPSADPNASGQVQDSSSILIKGYAGGEALPIIELTAQHLSGGTSARPVCTINPRVNFIYRNRLYFSVNINPNDGVSNSYYGLWSIGKNKFGRYTVTLERVATNANTETGVLAAAIAGDFVSMVHTSVGTLTFTANGFSPGTYNATSVYESLVNPEMPLLDKVKNKTLLSVAVHTTPLTTSAQVVLKVRVDSSNSADWKTVFTKTPTTPDTTLAAYESEITPRMNVPNGRNIEFRLESTNGAQITGYSYKYQTLTSTL